MTVGETTTMRVETKVITPVEASKILSEQNPYNYRKVNYATVDIYAKDMENGNWKNNGETIKFDFNGNLIDGQHRLCAIAKCNVPIVCVIVYNLDPKVADTIDIGRKRSIEQYLKWADNAYTKGATAIVQQVMTFEKRNKNLGQSSANLKVSHMQIVDEYVENKTDYNNAADLAKRWSKETKSIIKQKEAGSIYYYLTKRCGVDSNLVCKFFDNLCNTRINEKGIFATTITNLSNKEYCKRSGVTRIDEYIKCWNAFVNGCFSNRKNYSEWFLIPEKKQEV